MLPFDSPDVPVFAVTYVKRRRISATPPWRRIEQLFLPAGTVGAAVEQFEQYGMIAEGRTVLLEIDLQGARQVRTSLPQARLVFIAPPNWDELVARLVGRGTETAEQRERRLATAKGELAAADEFDHVVVNDDLGRAVDDLVSLLGL